MHRCSDGLLDPHIHCPGEADGSGTAHRIYPAVNIGVCRNHILHIGIVSIVLGSLPRKPNDSIIAIVNQKSKRA